MFRLVISIMLLGTLLLAASCSEDKKTTNPPAPDNTTSQLELIDVEALIAAVAPPAFTAPIGAPTGLDSLGIWTTGDYPLLQKVFGTEDNQALYRNINDFKQNFDILNACLKVDADSKIVTGTYVDSIEVEFQGDTMMVHYSATVTALSGLTTIPTSAQAIIGPTADIDYLISVTADEMAGGTEQFGVTVNDSAQVLLQYHYAELDSGKVEAQLVYANLNPIDSSFEFKGVCYVLYGTGELFTAGYNMTSESTSDFAYRMSWYSNDLPDSSDLLGCIIGGGNKDVEFALKYRQFMPADTNVMDSYSNYDQVFGPNYSEGTGLLSAYDAYLDDSLIYTYDAIPMEVITSPWAE